MRLSPARNLLGAELSIWGDVEGEYKEFNEERAAFCREQELNPLPAFTGIQAKLCRPDLLVEIEAIARPF